MQKLNRCLAGAAFLAAFIVTFSIHAVAQPADTKFEIQVTTDNIEKELRLNLQCDNVDATDVLAAIAKKGHTTIIIKEANAKNAWSLHLESATPETAIEKVCEAAGLDWTIQNQTYVVGQIDSQSVPPAQKPSTITMEFADVEVAPVLKLIGEQTNTKIIMGDNTSEAKLTYVRLRNESAEGAIQKIALAVGFDWKKLDDNTYSITKPEKLASR